MTSKRLFFVLLATNALLLIGIIGGAYSINKVLVAKAGKLQELKAKSLVLEQDQASLVRAKRDLQKFAELEKITKAVVPEDKNQAAAVREIVNLAAANNVKLEAISFPASTLGNNLPAGGATGGAAAASPKPAVNSKASQLSQLTPVKNIPGVYLLQITVNSDVNNPSLYSEFIGFLSDLERNRRTAQVNDISIQPDFKDSNYLSFTLTLNSYIKP
jgi:hypothetical protein